MVGVVIREAAADDYESLCELFDEVDALHRDNLPHLFRKSMSPFWEETYDLGLITDEDVGLFVAEVNQTVVGYVHAVMRDTPAMPILVPRRYAVVDGLGVRSDFRGGGIGRKLMHRIHEWAAVKGAIAIELNVYEFNENAREAFAAMGYSTLN
jgi:diamine N-acetyltransferase